jgi:catechol 2,3-dioxygenase-like lactoylglutathione lyase family enzyme
VTAIAELLVAGDPAAWRETGFHVDDDAVCRIGAVRIRLDPAAGKGGVRSWVLAGAPDETIDDVEGVPTAHGVPSDGPPPVHPNGTVAIDHLVMVTPDLARTIAAIERRLGVRLKRTRDTDTYGAPMRQAFFRLGEVILEVIGGPEPDPAGGRARFYGLALTVADLAATKDLLGDRMGTPKPAVQEGRAITTIKEVAGLRVAVALMSPAPASA